MSLPVGKAVRNQARRPLRIVFEGLPGAGKTSCVEFLSKAMSLEQVSEWALAGEEAYRSLRMTKPFYLVNDEIKELLARSAAGPAVLCDRHYFGALAYSAALDKVHGGLSPSGESAAKNRLEYARALKEGRLERPDVLVILDVSPRTSLKRQPRARRSDPLFGSFEGLAAMRAYYSRWARLGMTRVIDGHQPRASVRKEAAALLRDLLASAAPLSRGQTRASPSPPPPRFGTLPPPWSADPSS